MYNKQQIERNRRIIVSGSVYLGISLLTWAVVDSALKLAPPDPAAAPPVAGFAMFGGIFLAIGYLCRDWVR